MSAPACPFEDEVLLLGDGELPFARRIVVEAHLGVCPACAALEDALSLAEESLAAVPVAPLGAVDAALARLPRQAVPFRPWVLAAAAALLVGVAVHARRAARDAHDVAPPVAEQVAAVPSLPPVPAASSAGDGLPPLPALPPPLLPAGPALRASLASLDLGAADASQRVAAVAAETTRRGARGRDALAALLRDPDDGMRGRALAVAALVDGVEIDHALGALLGDAVLGDRAGDLLAARGGSSAQDALVAAYDRHPASPALEALVRVGGREAARALADRLWVAAPSSRRALLDAIVRTDAALGASTCLEAATAAPSEDDGDASLPEVAATVVRRHGGALSPHLRRAAAGHDALRARAAARALGWTGDPAAVPLLADLTRSPRTASAAVAALLDLGTSEAYDAAFEAAATSDAGGTVAAAYDGRRAAESVLLGRVLDADVARRGVALRLLARCGGPATARTLRLAAPPRALLPEAIDTLGAIGGDEAVLTLAGWMDVPGLATNVIDALGRTRAPSAVAALARAAADERRRPEIARALAHIESPDSVTLLVALLSDARAGGAALDALAEMPLGVVVPQLLAPCGESVPQPVRRALARLTGRDLGASPVAWRDWWSAQT